MLLEQRYSDYPNMTYFPVGFLPPVLFQVYQKIIESVVKERFNEVMLFKSIF
jgi:hypothetical protein